MIEVLQDMPAGVAGIRVSGRVTGEEMIEFKPELEKLLGGEDVRIVEVIAPDYAGFGRGGLVEDLKQGFGTLINHRSTFKRIAIVTDKEWVAHTVHVVGWMVPGELEVFGLDDLERAKEWAAG
ncbi:SpoIIAA family protein [Mycolicibacterium gadium]|uniref:STAS/SEC14 domain-containing protein n=1 Tax=Mycolicibacterium gadium TaxID=1794 RepID=A0ABT6GLF9_MYCGU|nr:STAS/SEC14 domain-containing protein [Mycolicibacterium gadium]MDG5482211.1 STAS/SEC14 domain-containing protein [Mycolicibacterium gadium]